jgi:multicomponent Na+:H+ antiporter subunit D
MVLGLASAVGGALFALLQDDLKRLLAYDTISQMGVLTVGLATGTPTGLAGTSYHMVNHALFKALLFLCAGAIVHMTGATKLSEMGGLARRYPLLAGAFVVGVFSIAGVPPFNGYVSLGLIHDALLKSGQDLPYVLTLLAQVLAMAALGKAAYQAFFRARAASGDFERDQSLHPGMVVALVVLAIGCVGFGVTPFFVLRHAAGPAAAALLHSSRYVHGVLGSRGTLGTESITFDYVSPTDLGAVAATVFLAIPLAWVAARWGDRAPAIQIRRIQTGSVNDYAAYLVGGLVAVVAVLAGAALLG